MEPPAPPEAAPPIELEWAATPVAAPTALERPAPEPPATDVSAPLTALDAAAPRAAAPRNALVDTAAKSPPEPATSAGGTVDIDRTIGQLTRLYRAITGRDLPLSDTPYAPIPARKAPVQHVEEQLDRLLGVLASTRTLLSRLAT